MKEIRRAARQRRPAPARAADQAAPRPRRPARRDHHRAQPDDPHRHDGRHRPEQRQILADRPPGADPGHAAGDVAARPRDDPQPAGADRVGRQRCRSSRVAEISFGSGPTTIQRYNQNRRIFVGADLAPDVVKGDAMAKIKALPTMKNLPAGVSNAPFGDDEWQAEMMQELHGRAWSRHPAGVRGAGAALPPLHVAAGQHGLAAAGAARRADRPACSSASRCRCRCSSAS